jgi:branched-chain amino acid aminotransferase/4-amino-4-deoxychorismate lyase
MKAVFNFAVVEAEKIPADLQNRAFLYGDGLFETLILQQGTLRFLADHYQRLTAGMAALHMRVPDKFTPGTLQNSILQLAKTCQLGDTARVRMNVWRQPGGLYTPESQDVDFLITVHPLVTPVISTKQKVILYEDIRLNHSVISSFKTTSALPYVMAGLARKAAGAEDAILLDTNGCVAECVASNIFWLRDGTWYTPGLESGCVAGVMRKNVLGWMGQNSIRVEQGLFAKEHLLAAQSVFCCNVAGIQWIQSIGDAVFGTDAFGNDLLQRMLTSGCGAEK